MGNEGKKNGEKCPLFEEMLMWTSYRYCIGRKSYVSSMAGDIASHYYGRLSDERLEFTANDIRQEIFDRLRFLPFGFNIHRTYNSDKFNPIDVLFNFIEIEKIDSIDKFAEYCDVEYDSHAGEYRFEKKIPTIKSYFSESDISDLLEWETLASCFDKKNHKIAVCEIDGGIEEIECFKAWIRKTVQIEDNPGYYRYVGFGWKPVWIPLKNYLEAPHLKTYMNEDSIKELKDM